MSGILTIKCEFDDDTTLSVRRYFGKVDIEIYNPYDTKVSVIASMENAKKLRDHLYEILSEHCEE